ncbi:SRPBCC family protein [Sandaracinus amylolyticus]|uniref:Putative glutathione S-transferase-related transmembrane protein n=1 Tax=Sandaracinus amylolyticus TaxID=927083 RepID=A0A0F6SD74_9BACT|nr:SRPBCC domain-containing protein [Sandaracinus amylolyticus]AKF02949.1 Putative glutathione S-transferase-related transmembrane protein [Sandaracinus amylolyticus]
MSDASRLVVTRVLPAPIARVFDAWTRSETLARWFTCTPAWDATAESDLRVGGRYRVVMHEGSRVAGVAYGEYLEIDRPRRLVFTWSAEGNAPVQGSVVTVELEAIGARTRLTLTHDLDPGSEVGRAHARGWDGTLARLCGWLEGA